MGSVESIAMMIFLAGDTRLCHKYSRFLIHSFNWDAMPLIDHNRLAERSSLLDYDVNRYVSIFNERTQGAQTPINAEEHLRGSALIVDPAASVSAGISTHVMPADWTISRIDTHWWSQICF